MTSTHQPAESTGRPLRRDAERNRERIIAAARAVFATRGLAATLDDVAHHAGVGIGTVYRRFPSKEALVEAALDERLDELAATVEAALEAPTGWDGLTGLLRQVAEMHAADRGLRDLALGGGWTMGHHERIGTRMVPLITRLIERAQAEGSLREDVTAADVPLILMMISEVALHSHPVRPDAYARYLQLLIDGLRRSPDHGDLGRALSQDDVDAVALHWLPSSESRRAPSPS
ncbi:TetR/AcrR family transcriptional regulator [Actinoplanes solisilvae]|uniref:TetR/AcrR family transcriptional regulator n=1 Tax=Actinoplanes solisilvae TaxID=2486853 RepID=UPI000FDAE44B|nr:TetR/AcrR family transcriptional regulator [Actinoplanes solisilvae]